MHRTFVTFTAIAIIGSLPNYGHASEPQWTRAEREKAVAIHSDFLVINYGTGCTVKQSYADSSMMELAFSGGEMHLLSPFYRGVKGDVTYWIDSKEKRKFQKELINAEKSFPEFPNEALEEMKSGQKLYVQVHPVGESLQTQTFGLNGLSAAIHTTETDKCLPVTNVNSEALSVQLSRAPNGLVVEGATTLPDKISIQLSVFSASGKLVGSDTVVVENGAYQSTLATKNGSTIPAGKYTVKFTSALWDFQPEEVAKELANGKNLPKEIRKKSYGQYVIDYTVVWPLK